MNYYLILPKTREPCLSRTQLLYVLLCSLNSVMPQQAYFPFSSVIPCLRIVSSQTLSDDPLESSAKSIESRALK
jgi:hypothetical protein